MDPVLQSSTTALIAAVGALLGALPGLITSLFKIKSENQVKRRADKMAEDSFTIQQYKELIQDLRQEVKELKEENEKAEREADKMRRRIGKLENEVRLLGGTVD